MNNPQDTVLTQREREVLRLVARGLTNKEIAEELCTSTSAVKIFLHQACEKLGARNRAQAVILAMRRGAIQTEDVYSLEELADFLASLSPEDIQTIAELVRQRLEKTSATEIRPSPAPARIPKLLSLQR
jgi:DNA-binding CsgD family transcriptional regulator